MCSYRSLARALRVPAVLLLAVTGTDGKTTTVHLVYSILRRAGLRAGMIGTVGAVIYTTTDGKDGCRKCRYRSKTCW